MLSLTVQWSVWDHFAREFNNVIPLHYFTKLTMCVCDNMAVVVFMKSPVTVT